MADLSLEIEDVGLQLRIAAICLSVQLFRKPLHGIADSTYG